MSEPKILTAESDSDEKYERQAAQLEAAAEVFGADYLSPEEIAAYKSLYKQAKADGVELPPHQLHPIAGSSGTAKSEAKSETPRQAHHSSSAKH